MEPVAGGLVVSGKEYVQIEMEALNVENVRKSFRGDMSFSSEEVLHGVSFFASPGEILGFLGPNGAGKTTTIKVILGLLKADSGSIKVFGRPIEDNSVKTRIGYLPENPYLLPHLSLREYLEYCGELSGLSGRFLEGKIESVVSMLELERYIDLRLKNFSKGMTQKAALAQAIIHDPDLLILDEPFSGLDPIGRKRMKDILVGLKRKGKTIFFSSHILPDMEALCDRTYIIRDGMIVRSVGIDELFKLGEGNVEITATGCSKESLEKIFEYLISADSVGEEITLLVRSQEFVRTVIQYLYNIGADVLKVTKQHMTLEEIFLEEVSSDNHGGAKSRKEKEPVL